MMTYKKFVEQAVDHEATNWLTKLAGEGWHVYSEEVRLERNGESILYEVDFRLHKAGQSWIRKSCTVGGAIGEHVGICNSVIWSGNDENGIRRMIWAHNKELRDICGVTAETFSL